MQEMSNDYDQLEQTDFPAFPVEFRPEPEECQEPPVNLKPEKPQKGPFKLPQKQIQQLQAYINNIHNISYPQLFRQTWQTGKQNIEYFFSMQQSKQYRYHPLDRQFIQQMKNIQDKLKIIRLSSHKIYIGQFIEEKCTGMSIVIFKNGNIYQGIMNNNKRDGKGFYLQLGTGWFKGNFNHDLKTQTGIQVLYKKWAYKGQYINGLRHQKGIFVQKEGFIYSGQWKLGIMHGKGTLRSNQSNYHGNLVNSLKHGQGQQRFLNGDIYKGQFQNNRFDGFGTYNWKEGDATYQGSFKNGLRHGKGKWSSGQTKYSGAYVEGLKQGYGQLYFPSGNFYKGNFVNDKREGYGQMFWTDSSFYKGDWKGGVQNGKGQLYLIGSQVISGLFENSILVQIIPSLYQKQMEISSMGIQDLFGSNPKMPTTNKTRTASQSKPSVARKKLTKIEQQQRKKNVIKDQMYFRTPQKSPNGGKSQHLNPHRMTHPVKHLTPNRHLSHDHRHSHDKQGQCKCIKRLQNFRLRQKLKTKMNQSKVQASLHYNH